MHQTFQSRFIVPEVGLPLVFEGTYEQTLWADGKLVSEDSGHGYPVEDGIPVFVPTRYQTWEKNRSVTGEWVAHKLKQYRKREFYSWGYPPIRERCCQQMASSGGLILELAIGPDGGDMPMVLLENENAIILANELGHNVLKGWREYQRQSLFGPNLSFACFDARKMPLRSDCVDIISSNGAFTEIQPTDVALGEAFRVLEPDGRIYMFESRITPGTVSMLPDHVQQKHGLPRAEYADLLEAAGFNIVSVQQYAEFPMPVEWGELSKAAAHSGVTLAVEMLSIEACKG